VEAIEKTGLIARRMGKRDIQHQFSALRRLLEGQ